MIESLISLVIALCLEALIAWWVIAWWLRRKRRLEWEERMEDIRVGIILMDARRQRSAKEEER